MSAKGFWSTLPPSEWADAPQFLSVSTAKEVETCPRRWSLSSAAYPDLWSGYGYPPRPTPRSLEGVAVHAVLEFTIKELVKAGCTTVASARTTEVLRSLGGFTRIVEQSIKRIVADLAKNPRASFLLESIERTLRGQLSAIRSSAQTLLARIQLPPAPVSASWKPRPAGRVRLGNGSYAEIELRAPTIGWKGKVDVLLVSDSECEVVDFKTGGTDPSYEDQVRTYALLWWLDEELNPSKRSVTRTRLAYVNHEVVVEAPTQHDLVVLESRLRKRGETVRALIAARPPLAKPSAENCAFCNVRQLCPEYWAKPQPDPGGSAFGDVEVRIVTRHGPSSWDGVVVRSGRGPAIAGTALIRTASDLDFRSGQTFRLLGVHVAPKDADQPIPIVTLSGMSEVFLVA
jgi:hypothetical protein